MMCTMTSDIMCTATSCTKIRRYIFVPKRVENIYCLKCITLFHPHLSHLFENVCIECTAQCGKCGEVDNLFVAKTLKTGTHNNNPVGCTICIHKYQPEFKITRDYVETSKLNRNKLCSYLYSEQKRLCYKESSWFKLPLPESSTSSSSSVGTTTLFPTIVEDSYCSECIDKILPAKKRKFF
jgi:hypothetical protein